MAFKLGAASLRNLEGVHVDLVRVVSRAIEITTVDFKVIEGVRTVARQHELYGQGRTASELRAKGVNPALARPKLQKVTWTLNSNHFSGRAVDLLPAPYDWRELEPFNRVADAMFAAGIELGIGLRWGADWDRDGKWREKRESDSPHFELA